MFFSCGRLASEALWKAKQALCQQWVFLKILQTIIHKIYYHKEYYVFAELLLNAIYSFLLRDKMKNSISVIQNNCSVSHE